jgi:hypothetical protein
MTMHNQQRTSQQPQALQPLISSENSLTGIVHADQSAPLPRRQNPAQSSPKGAQKSECRQHSQNPIFRHGITSGKYMPEGKIWCLFYIILLKKESPLRKLLFSSSDMGIQYIYSSTQSIKKYRQIL